jgi:monoamine oxidase
MSANDGRVLDYAIVGAGVSGLYSGWRLLTDFEGEKPTVELFESSGRIGGRLLSVVPPNIPSARVELGGMRYIKGVQSWVTSLVEHLKLETESLAAAQPQNLQYVRGKHLRTAELTDSTQVPYALRHDESSVEDLGNLTAVAAMRALKPAIEELTDHRIEKWQDLAKLTPFDWKKVAEEGTFEGTPLYELPMRYLMLRTISHEAFRMARDTGGYDSIHHTWNAADGFCWNVGDYGPDVSYLHVKNGYQQVPLKLAELFADEVGGTIHLDTRLKGFDQDADGNLVLDFEGPAGARTVRARHLILGMPRRSLELLEPRGPVLDPANTKVQTLIKSVTPIPLFKLAICYDRPWWDDVDPKIKDGKSVTDLPIRQCYYWKVDPTTNHAVILIYDDGIDLDYWAGLRDTRTESFANHLPEDMQLPDWSDFPAPKRMVEEVHRQLLELHGNPPNVPAPYAAAYRDWGEDPFGGGANFWPVGVKSYAVTEAMVQPDERYPVYVCGDCYSHGQGWVEGALGTAELMLQGRLGLNKPEWKKYEDHPA